MTFRSGLVAVVVLTGVVLGAPADAASTRKLVARCTGTWPTAVKESAVISCPIPSASVSRFRSSTRRVVIPRVRHVDRVGLEEGTPWIVACEGQGPAFLEWSWRNGSNGRPVVSVKLGASLDDVCSPGSPNGRSTVVEVWA